MALVDSWTLTNIANSTSHPLVIPVGHGVAVGQTLAIGVCFDSAATTVTATDSRGNTYVTSQQQPSTNATEQILLCKPTTALVAGDTITITTSVTRFRTAAVFGVFDDISSITQNGTGGGGTATTGTTASATMTATTTVANTLVLFGVGGASPINALSVSSPLTLIGTIKTAAGSAERVSGLAYKYVTSTGAQTASGTITSGEWDAVILALPQSASAFTGSASLSGSGSLAASASGPIGSGVLSGEGTLTASGPPSGYDPSRIAVFGDSLTFENGNGATYITAALAAAGWATDSAHLYIDGLNSREIWGAGATPLFGDAWDTMIASGFNPGTVIFALGTNNGGYSVADTTSKAHSAMAKIGAGRTVHWIGVGYQTQSDCDYTYVSGNPAGSRYVEGGTRSRINVVIQNMLEAGAFNAGTEAVPVFHDWNRSTKAASARAGGSTYWDATDTSAPSGNARHMTNSGYQTYRAPYYAESVGAPPAAALSGTGTLTVTGVPRVARAASLSGSGTLAAAGTPALSQNGGLSGAGTLAAGGSPAPVNVGTLSGSGTLTALAAAALASTAALSGSGTLTAAGTTALASAVVLSGSGTLTAMAAPSIPVAASLSGSGTLTAGGTPAGSTGASLSGSGVLTATGTPAGLASGALSGTGALTAAGGGLGFGGVNLSGSGSLSATAKMAASSAATLSGSGSLSAAGKPVASSPATLSGLGTLSASGLPGMARVAELAGLGTLAALGVPRVAGTGALSGVGVLTAVGQAVQGPSDESLYVTVAGVRRPSTAYVIDGGVRRTAVASVIVGGAKRPV